MLRRNRNKLKPFVSPTEEIDKINKIKIERELKEEENKNLVLGLEENRERLSNLVGSFEVIEKEHQNRLAESEKQYFSIIDAINNKNKELSTLNSLICNLKEKESELLARIPILESDKFKLEDEIYEKTSNFNQDKNNSEIYLTSLREKINEENKVYNEVSEKLVIAREDLRLTIESINNENGILSTRKKDMDIYESRLRKKYPNDKIIL
jgi:chromosome segregation ATPase